MAKKRSFGRIRQLSSGRYQARYPGPDGIDRPAPYTFKRKKDAQDWLANKHAEIVRDEWLNPDAGKVSFGDFARSWIEERPNLQPSTVQLYRVLLRKHLLPTFEHVAVANIKEANVRRWRKELLDSDTGSVTVAKSYRLLRAIMNTAVEDGLIRRNPCRIKGAGIEKSPERPVLTVSQVYAVADAIGPRYRALVLLATFASLRWGELAALRRCDVDLEEQVLRVEASLSELNDGTLLVGSPKSDAGVRKVALPSLLLRELGQHLEQFGEAGPKGLVFVGPKGAQLRRGNFRRIWSKATTAAGVPDVHFHDLRHTGNTFAAATGASLRELMGRMGHSSSRAALIYQHATEDRDRLIADMMDAFVQGELKPETGRKQGRRKKGARQQSGTQRARRRS